MAIPMPETLPCPFCGADASACWVMDEKEGKSMRVECSRNGECPSPSWKEPADHYETDAQCVASVIRFWNRRAAPQEPTDAEVEAAARAICAEQSAFMGEPACWAVKGADGCELPWPNPGCNEPGCHAVARAALIAARKARA